MVMRRRTWQALAAAAGLVAGVAAAVVLWPQARDAARLLLAQEDPVLLTQARLAIMQNRNAAIHREIEAALEAGDADLAASFVELARTQNIELPDAVAARVAEATAAAAAPMRQAINFADGVVTGEADDMAGLAGVVAGDLLVFGDIRDVVREGGRLAEGGEADSLILGLAAAGLAATAATYAMAGAAAPLRAGLTVTKGARRAGRLSEPLAAWGLRTGREVVDGPALRQAVASVSAFAPARSAHAVKAALRLDRAGALVRFGKDVGRIAGKAGGRGAVDVLKVAHGPKEVARAARLAEARGGEVRALIKLFGRGALVLASGAFQLALWLFWLAWALFGALVSLKAFAERLTQSACDRRRRRRAGRGCARPALAAAA
jgi:hypothetical protein